MTENINIQSRKILNFIEKSNKIHKNYYDYSKSKYKNCKLKILIICPIHGPWQQSPKDHQALFGCPNCNSSKGENRIRIFLRDNGYKFKPQYTFEDCRNIKPLPFDFGILNDDGSLKFLCEFQGRHHFECVKYGGTWEDAQKNFQETIFRDAIKKDYCEKNGIKILYISYKDLDKVEEILSEYLKLNLSLI